MTLTEYLNQKFPFKMPVVKLKPGEYRIVSDYIIGNERQRIVLINDVDGEYLRINNDTRLFTTDSDGNKKRYSCFNIWD